MQDVVTVGTGTAVNFGNMSIAGKTGTTTKNRDALFSGFTPYYTCSVWCGYDDNTPQDGTMTSNPKTIWKNIMSRIHENLEHKEFTQPEGIITAAVCRKSGKLAVDGLCNSDPRGSMVETEYFAAGTVPTEYCDHHVSATICAASGLLANEFCPAETRQTGVYIVGGSGGTEDSPYLLAGALANENYCDVHTAVSIIPEITPVPEIPVIDGNEEGHIEQEVESDNNENKEDKENNQEEDKHNREDFEGGEQTEHDQEGDGQEGDDQEDDGQED